MPRPWPSLEGLTTGWRRTCFECSGRRRGHWPELRLRNEADFAASRNIRLNRSSSAGTRHAPRARSCSLTSQINSCATTTIATARSSVGTKPRAASAPSPASTATTGPATRRARSSSRPPMPTMGSAGRPSGSRSSDRVSVAWPYVRVRNTSRTPGMAAKVQPFRGLV